MGAISTAVAASPEVRAFMTAAALPTTVLDAILLDVDEPSIQAAAQARVRWEKWDGVSPINGVPAEQIHQRPDVGSGGAYIVYVDNVATIFQPHLPGAGFEGMSDAQLSTEAETQVAALVEQLAYQAVLTMVMDKLRRLVPAVPITPSLPLPAPMVNRRGNS